LEGLEFVLRIWDTYLLHGESILYCFALVILRYKLNQYNTAPLQQWLNLFSDIKKLNLPSQAHIFEKIGDDDFEQSLEEFGENNYFIENNDSSMLIPLVQEALTIFIDHHVKTLFLQHEQ